MANQELKKITAIKDFEMYKTNPFMSEAIETIKENKKVKRITMKGGRSVQQQITNYDTGEVVGETMFMKYTEVEEDKFAKIYLSKFSVFYNIKPQGLKVFGYILNKLKPNQDEIIFILDEVKEYTGYKSETSIRIGLTNLLENKVIARGRNEILYYINPMIVFNGNRVTYAETFQKKEKLKELDFNK